MICKPLAGLRSRVRMNEMPTMCKDRGPQHMCFEFPRALYPTAVVLRFWLRNNSGTKICTMWLTNACVKLTATQFPSLRVPQHADTNSPARPLST